MELFKECLSGKVVNRSAVDLKDEILCKQLVEIMRNQITAYLKMICQPLCGKAFQSFSVSLFLYLNGLDSQFYTKCVIDRFFHLIFLRHVHSSSVLLYR